VGWRQGNRPAPCQYDQGLYGTQFGRPEEEAARRQDARTDRARGGCNVALRRLHYRPYEAAIKHSASKEEIAEALGVAAAVNAGAALVYSTRVMDAFKEYPRAVSSQVSSA